jgi:hypothetical protein
LFGARHRLLAALLAPDFFVFGIPHRPIAFFYADYSHPQAGKRYSRWNPRINIFRNRKFAGVAQMVFIHQQIQSFLNLGVCKEYPIMAKPKFTKNNNDTKETVTTPSSLPSFSDTSTGVALTEATPANPVTESRKPARKPEIVKTEARTNLIPINVEDEVRRLAYLLSERRGFEPGHEAEDWLTAEREIRQRYRQQSA